MITLMWAMDVNKVIGNGQRLPWYYKEDMQYFKTHAYHKKALMGYQTYVSMLKYFSSGKLPFSDIYIASRNQTEIKNATVINDVKKFLDNCDEDIIVIGGAQIYKIAFDYADALRITYVLKPHFGDTYFPKYSLKAFKLVEYETYPELIFTHYERIKK